MITFINCVFYQIFYQNYIKLNWLKLQNLNIILHSKYDTLATIRNESLAFLIITYGWRIEW